MQSRERADSELGEHVKKAVSPVEAAPKAKHVRAIIVYAWDYRTTKSIWNVLRMHPVLTDQVQGFKALVLIHKLLVGGPQIALEEAMSSACATFLDTCLNTLGSNNLGLGYGALIRGYIRYLRRKLQFHAAHSQYSGNFDYEDYVSLRSVGNLDEGYQNLTELFDFIGEAFMFGNLIFEQLGTYLSAGQAGAGECRTSALVPLVEESGGLFKYMTSMLTAMHLCVEQPEVLQPLVDRYHQLFSGFSAFYQKCRLNNFLHGLVSIPEIPNKPTEFTATENNNKTKGDERELKYYEEEKYVVPVENVVEDDAAIQALKAMHEKYVQVKRQLLYITREHQLVLNELEHSNQQVTILNSQSEEYRRKYENVVKLYNELRERFVSEAKQHKMIEEGLKNDNDKLRAQLSKQCEVEEDPFAATTECFADNELEQVLKLIMLVQDRLKNAAKGGKIPELASAIAELLRRAIILQDIIIDKSDSLDRKELYCKNPIWSKGLISAARSIGTSTELLADDHLAKDEENREEKVQAAAIQVNSGVMQLVSAARVKAPPQSAELDALLEAAGIVAYLVKNINQRDSINPNTGKEQVEQEGELDDTGQKIAEMNLRVEVLKREKELERAREELARMRKANYSSQPNQ